MLFYKTIEPRTLQLLKKLQSIPFLEDFILVGGTGLALQIGHRVSIDLDLFTTSNKDISLIPDLITELGVVEVSNQSQRILNSFIDNIKVDFVSYRYAFIEPIQILDGLKLASIQDIAAMKLAAITGRGSRKDFIDLYFLLNYYKLQEMFEFYKTKYPDGSAFLVFKSLLYFKDAEVEPMPKMLSPIIWKVVKSKITTEVRKLFP